MSVPLPIVIAIDGLRASSLGAYGNSVIATPAIDGVAARGVTYDWCFAGSYDLVAVYQSLWTPAARRPQLVVTDEPIVRDVQKELDGWCELVETNGQEPAASFAETGFAQLMARAGEQLDGAAVEGLIWIHSRAFFGPWDAPSEVAVSLTDESDPEIPRGISPPDVSLADADGDDRTFIETCRYHAELIAIDAALEGFVEWLAEHEAYGSRPIAICGTRGFSLGEHGYIGGRDTRLFSEQIHVPCITQSLERALCRDSELRWLQDVLPVPTDQSPRAELIWRGDDSTTCVRTADWHARIGSDSGDELFVKPDDRFDANDVASLCPDELADLIARASNFDRTSN